MASSLGIALRGYRAVLSSRDTRVLALASVVNAPSLAVPLALVLLVGATYGYAAAGAAVAAQTLGIGISSPVRGRLMDRYGQPRVLAALAVLHAASLGVVTIAVTQRYPLPVVVVAAAFAGAPASLLTGLRVLWKDLVPTSELTRAYSFQAALNEFLYIVGPLAIAGVAAVGTPALAVGVAAASHVLATGLFVSARAARRWRAETRVDARWLGALVSAGMRSVVVLNILVGAVYGVLQVAVPSFTAERGTAAAAGVALAAISAGSVVGGLVYGARGWMLSVPGRLGLLLSLQALVLAPVVLARDVLLLSVLMLLVGVVIGPLGAICFELLDAVAPTGMAAEATAWFVTAWAIGAAAGSALAGPLVALGEARAGLLGAWLTGLLAFGVFLVLRRTFRRTLVAGAR